MSENKSDIRKELTIEACTENLYQVLAFVDEQLEYLGCSPAVQMRMDLVVEEIFANVANYAYAPQTGSVTVICELESEPSAIILTFEDSGVPYDPLKKDDPDVTLSAEERQIGGLGIFMIKKNVDDISYEWRDGKNILRIRKNL